MQTDIGILLALEAFYREITEETLKECLERASISTKEQLTKHLGELGGNGIMILTEGDMKMNEQEALKQWGYGKPTLAGQGAFSRVYRVQKGDFGRFYACKVSRQTEMLRREAEILKEIQHPLFRDLWIFGRKMAGDIC